MNLFVVDAPAHRAHHLASPLPGLAVEEFVRLRHIVSTTPAFIRTTEHCTTSESGTTQSRGVSA
jgi:hypothetical protein